MVQRTFCLCEDKHIGIETIYTVIDGKQINIPDKLKELRIKSRNNQFFCPCECGSNLILVAGIQILRSSILDLNMENTIKTAMQLWKECIQLMRRLF